MKQIKAITFVVLLTVVAGLSLVSAEPVNPPLNPAPPNATLGCRDGQSDITLQAGITNNGPDVVPAGTKIYVKYNRLGSDEKRFASGVTATQIEVGKTGKLELSPRSNWYPQIEQCTASFTAPKLNVKPGLVK